MKLIYCAGKSARFESIALTAGWALGAQLPAATSYPILFADQDWKRPNRAAYMAALAQHRPEMATVLDYERDEQRAEVLDWAEEAAQYVQMVLIIPKLSGVIDHLPRRISGADVGLAYSVPTRYGGTSVPIWEFAGWPVHLLGGSPQSQRCLYAYLAGLADVISADGNMANKMAHRCQFWCQQKGPKGHWRQLQEVGLGDYGPGSNAKAFELSCQNIMEFWRHERVTVSHQLENTHFLSPAAHADARASLS